MRRSDLGGRDQPLRPKLGRSRGERRPKLFVANVLAAKELAGFGAGRRAFQPTRSPIGRGGVAAWRAGRALFGQRGRRVIVKARIVRHGPRMTPLGAHLSYLRREGVTKDGQPARMFDAESEDADIGAFAKRAAGDRHHFRFVVSPEDAADLTDLHAYTRDLVGEMERDLGSRLDWVAVDHWNTDNPHVHLIVRGKETDGRDLVIHREYITRGLRARAQELATIELGHRAEQEIRAKLADEVMAERWTNLDRTLQRAAAIAPDGILDLRPERDGSEDDRQVRGLLMGRLQRLEAMGLARSAGPAQWMLAEEAEPTLREIGIRGDIIRTMNKSLGHNVGDVAIYGADGPERPVIGGVVAKGLDDELAGKPYLIIEGIDGRSHYVRLGAAVDLADIPDGGLVRAVASRDGKRTILRVLSDLTIDEQVGARGAMRRRVGRPRSGTASSPSRSASQGLVGLGVEHMQDGANQQGMAGLLPVVPPLECAFRIDQHVRDVLDVAHFTDPFGKIGKRAVTVDITSVVRASDRSFRIAWVEHPYEEGAPLPAERWSAILTVVIQTPHTEERLRQNPLGIYIDAISWARELGGVP